MSKRAWSVWSAGQYGDESHYVRTFADKGEAQRFMARRHKMERGAARRSAEAQEE